MKFNKKCFAAVAAVMAVSMACAFAACSNSGNGENANEGENKEPTTTEKTISYQLEGEYTDDTLKGYGFDYFYLLNLYSDNTISYSGYNQLGMDTSAYATNSSFTEKWGKGSWKVGEDVEGEECINITLIYDTGAVNSQTGSQLVGTFKYSVYENASGTITFTIDVPFASGRQSSISGSSTVKYNTYDDFIAAHAYKEELPSSSAAVLEDSTNHYKAYCLEDGSVKLYSGKLDAGTNKYKYLLSKEGTWRYADSKLIFNFGSDIEATVSGSSASLAYTYSLGTQPVELTLTCADASALLKEGSGSNDTAQPIVTFTNSENEKLKLDVYEGGTATFTGNYNSTKFLWTYSDGVITFTEADPGENTAKVVTVTVNEDNSATFTYENKYTYGTTEVDLGGTVTCADVSALTGGSAAVTTLVTFTGTTEANTATFAFNSDGTAAMSAFGGQMTINFTWAYANGTLTVTPTNSDDGAAFTVTISGTKGTFSYSKTVMSAYTAGGDFSCDDISALIS